MDYRGKNKNLILKLFNFLKINPTTSKFIEVNKNKNRLQMDNCKKGLAMEGGGGMARR